MSKSVKDMLKTKIIPSENEKYDAYEDFKKLDYSDYLPKPNGFCIMIQGSVGSGKSSLLYTLLNLYQKVNVFDIILVYCPTSDSHEVFKKFDDEKTDVVINSKFNDLEFSSFIKDLDEDQRKIREKIDEHISKDEKIPKGLRPVRVLVILDDAITDPTLIQKVRPNSFDTAVINRRHMGLNIIITCQNYLQASPNLRANNPSHFILMKANERDLKKISEEHNGGQIMPQTFMNLYKGIKDVEPYGYLMVDYKADPDKRFRSGLSDILSVADIIKNFS